MNFYEVLIYNPLLNILIFFYQTIAFKDLGLSIIFLTILIRIIYYPMSNKALSAQSIIQKIQPEIKIIQEKYKKNHQKQIEEIMAIRKKYNINPFSVYFFVIFFAIIQIPVFFAIYQIFSQNFEKINLGNIYNFISKPEVINPTFLGLINLTKPSIIIAGLAALFQFLEAKLRAEPFKNKKNINKKIDINKIILYLGPVITFIVLSYFSSAISLYWLVANITSLINQYFINKKLLKQENELG